MKIATLLIMIIPILMSLSLFLFQSDVPFIVLVVLGLLILGRVYRYFPCFNFLERKIKIEKE